MKAKIAVLVSGGGTNLQALIDAEQAGKIKSGEIVLVVSNSKTAYALERARLAGIESLCLTRKECGGQETFEDKLIEALDSRGIDLIILAGFMSILSETFTGGVKVTGATVHYVNEIPDGGEIILQKAVNIRPGDTPETLQRRVMEQAEWKLLPRAAELVCRRLVKEKGKTI